MIATDMICALIAFVVAACAGLTFELTSPSRRLCVPLPFYHRLPIAAFGFNAAFHGSHWCWKAFQPHTIPVSWMTVLTWSLIAWFHITMAIATARRRLPPAFWQEVETLGVEWALRLRKVTNR
jgi:hypothetical protein